MQLFPDNTSHDSPPRYLPPRPMRDGVHLNSCLSRGRTSCGKYTPTVFLQARETAVIPSGSPPPPRYPGAGPAHLGLHARRRVGRRIRHQYRHRLEMSHRDGGAAGHPRPEAEPGPGRHMGRRPAPWRMRFSPHPDGGSPAPSGRRTRCPATVRASQAAALAQRAGDAGPARRRAAARHTVPA